LPNPAGAAVALGGAPIVVGIWENAAAPKVGTPSPVGSCEGLDAPNAEGAAAPPLADTVVRTVVACDLKVGAAFEEGPKLWVG
jgi:hypothetical protein